MDAKTRRAVTRKQALNYRDDHALKLFASGLRIKDIAYELHEVFGTSVKSESNVWEMVRRALDRHAVDLPTVDQARVRYLLHLDELLSTWLPLSLAGRQDNDGNQLPPSDKAAEITLKVLDRIGAATGAITPPRSGDTNLTVNVVVPPDAESKRMAIIADLQREATKMLTVEGHLADAGTSLAARQGGERDTGLIPPPPQITKE